LTAPQTIKESFLSGSDFGGDGAQVLQEIITTLIILEDRLTFDTATNDMVQSAGGVDA
jgi:hypothetical protein